MSDVAKAGGEAFDCKGRPIYPGDLLKSYHFTDRRRKRHWLYHVAVIHDGHLEAVPTSHLQPGMEKQGGRFWIFKSGSGQFEIIDGHGPGDCLSYEDRPRRKPVAIEAREAEKGGE